MDDHILPQKIIVRYFPTLPSCGYFLKKGEKHVQFFFKNGSIGGILQTVFFLGKEIRTYLSV